MTSSLSWTRVLGITVELSPIGRGQVQAKHLFLIFSLSLPVNVVGWANEWSPSLTADLASERAGLPVSLCSDLMVGQFEQPFIRTFVRVCSSPIV